jgi:hypothetical protein
MTGEAETINQGPHWGDAGPSCSSKDSSDSIMGNASSETDSDKDVFCTPPESVSSDASSSTPTRSMESAPNNGESEERDSFAYVQPGTEIHEAMKEDFLLKTVRDK